MKKISTLIILFSCIFLTIPNNTFSQIINVKGKITDERDLPLIGGNVIVRGTAIGASTDLDGNYSLTIPDTMANIVIEARFIGYKSVSKEITEKKGTITLNFQLLPDIIQMEQVVVTGTSVLTQKSNLGNSISSIDSKELEMTGSGLLDASLSGKIPGALVQLNSGTPGGGTSVRIRGVSTISREAEPLYIIDGTIIDNSSLELLDLGGYTSNRLADLDPNDIERIEVVKGAAAAAIYGSRANNGVIQIFTKRGTPGKIKISLKNTVGFDQLENKLELNSYPFNANGQPVQRYDYQDDIFQTAVTNSTYLSLSGGDEFTRYYLGGSYSNNEGIVKSTNYQKENIRLNVDKLINKWINISTNLNYTHSLSDLVPNGGFLEQYGVLTNFFFTSNDYSYYPDPVSGKYPKAYFQANPLDVIANWKSPQEVSRFIGSLRTIFTPLENLSIEYRFGYDTYTQTAKQYIPRNSSAPAIPEGRSINSDALSKSINSDIDVRYNFNFNENISSSTSLGMNYQYSELDLVYASARDLPTLVELVQGSQQFSNEMMDKRRTIGYYVQETFGYKDKLFLTGSLRIDGSSVFGPDERWQLFPKVSASYKLSDYDFWKNSVGSVFNFFKLRAALGYSGGQPASSFSNFSNYVFEPNSGRSGLVNSNIQGNSNLKPERMREVEIGSDFEMLNGRIGFELTYYDRLVNDLILPKNVAPSTGYTEQLDNVGELSSKGFELLVKSLNISNQSFQWTTTFNFSNNNSKIKKLSSGGPFPIPNSFNVVWVYEDQAPGIFYGTTYGGFNEKGIPIIGPRKIIGDPNPDYIMSLINEFFIGNNFSFRFQFDAVLGFDIFNFNRRLLETPAFGSGKEYEKELKGEVPKGYFQARRSIFQEYIEDGSFIKLREVSVQYTLRNNFIKSLGLTSVQFFAVGRNLFTITDYTGWDPEINAGAQSTLVRGYDFATVPIPRSFQFGITLNL